MAPAPTGPSASRGPPPTGPKVRTAIPVALTGGSAHASGSSSGPSRTSSGAAGTSANGTSSYGYDADRARLLTGQMRTRGRGRGFGRANGALHGHAAGGMGGMGGMGMGTGTGTGMGAQAQLYPGAYQQQHMPYSNGFGHAHTSAQAAGAAAYPAYGYPGQFADPGMMAGPSSAPALFPAAPTGPSLTHKATAPKPPSRPPTPPPPPPTEPGPDARIAENRSPVKIALPRIAVKPGTKSPVKEKAESQDKARRRDSGANDREGKERQAEFLPVEEATRSPISITFASSSTLRAKSAHTDFDGSPAGSSSKASSSRRTSASKSDRPPTPPPPPSSDIASPPPPPPPASTDAPPPPPSEPPSSPRALTTAPRSPRALKKAPTSPRPGAPRLPPPPPPPPALAPPPPAETKRPPSSPRQRVPSLTKAIVPPAPKEIPNVAKASSKWDVAPTSTPAPDHKVNGESIRSSSGANLPPAHHFRDMAVAAVEAEDDTSDDSEDEDADEPSWSREMPPHRQLPPHLANIPAGAPPPPPPAPRSPTPPPPPPPPPAEPEWEAPSWFFPRNVGSYTITLSTDGRKEVGRRVDGMVDGERIAVVDPRKKGQEGRGSAKVVTHYRAVTYPWGPMSVGPKPPEPATAVLLTGLSPLTTADQVRTFLRPHGRIRELDAKMDPKSGMQLGVCWVKFEGPAGSASGDRGRKGGAGMSAHDVAVAVVKACNGHRVGMTSTERVTVVLDGEGKKAIKAVKEEMERRYPKPKPKVVPAVPPPKPATPMPPPASTIGGRGTPNSGSGGATPRVPSGLGLSAGQATGTKLPLPVPVPIKLHAQSKAGLGLPRNPLLSSSARMPPATTAAASPSSLPIPRAIPLGSSRYAANLPSRPLGMPTRPIPQSFTASFVEAPFEKDSRRDGARNRSRERGRERDSGRGGNRIDTYIARGRSSSYSRSPPPSRFRSRSRSTDYSTDTDSDSDYYRRDRFRGRGRLRSRSRSRSRSISRSPSPRRSSLSGARPLPSHKADSTRKEAYIPRREVKQKVEDDDKTKLELANNGRPAVWIDKEVLSTTQQHEVHLWDHFRNFRPENIIRAITGFYVLFADHESAERAKILDGSVMHGTKISLVIKTGHVKARPAAEPGKNGRPPVAGAKKAKTAPAKAATKVVSPKIAKAKVVKRRIEYTSSEDSEDDHSSKKARTDVGADKDKDQDTSAQAMGEQAKAPVPQEPTAPDEEGESELDVEAEVEVESAPKGKKRPAPKVATAPAPLPPAKKAKRGRKARIVSPAPLITPPEIQEPPVAEIKLDEQVSAPASVPIPLSTPATTKATPAPKATKAKASRIKKSALGPLQRFIADEHIVDEEDAYWLSRALAMPEGATSDVEEDDNEMDPLLPEEHPLHHTSGAWRVEGLRKIPPALKSAYLPQRNRAQAAAEDASAIGAGLTTGRTARASGRRLALDMETHRKTLVSGASNAAKEAASAAATAENDIFAFNQLRIRKKQLRFARSAIEGYGLYAMETIQVGEMVCEYVGELVRSSVADLREAKYLKQGIGSSYLFRIDADVVCDATFRGSVSRLINHSCDPSASAKIISINGQSKIVIYAKRLLSPGEEILYDYKFPLESDPALRVPCLCGSSVCRGFLN